MQSTQCAPPQQPQEQQASSGTLVKVVEEPAPSRMQTMGTVAVAVSGYGQMYPGDSTLCMLPRGTAAVQRLPLPLSLRLVLLAALEQVRTERVQLMKITGVALVALLDNPWRVSAG